MNSTLQGEMMNKLWHSHTTENTAIKRNEVDPPSQLTQKARCNIYPTFAKT